VKENFALTDVDGTGKYRMLVCQSPSERFLVCLLAVVLAVRIAQCLILGNHKMFL
jgi:hypothetical protein